MSDSIDPYENPNSILAQNKSVYFDSDSWAVKEEFDPLLQQHASFLQSRPDRCAHISGNTDERGTSEDNLQLGQKRSEAVRRALSLLGVREPQMEAVSFGKEKPVQLGHDEEAWAKNRRVDIDYRLCG